MEEAVKEEIKYIDPLTRLKQERAAKKEKKKAIKVMTQKFGNPKMAKKMVKTAVSNLQRKIRRTTGRGG